LLAAEFLRFAHSQPSVQLCFVDDGSTDQTLSALQALERQASNITVLHLASNSGKGEAVRQGMLYGMMQPGFEIFGFWDADLATPLHTLEQMVGVFQSRKDILLIAGSRYLNSGAGIKRTPMRRILGRFFSGLTRLYTGVQLKDSQCGAKLFLRNALKVSFNEPFESKWVFDAEVLRRVRKSFGEGAIFEFPLKQWEERGGGSLKAKHYWRVPLELLKLALRNSQ
jgi:glycosyltransferase involved in cell wall biosynthesis